MKLPNLRIKTAKPSAPKSRGAGKPRRGAGGSGAGVAGIGVFLVVGLALAGVVGLAYWQLHAELRDQRQAQARAAGRLLAGRIEAAVMQKTSDIPSAAGAAEVVAALEAGTEGELRREERRLESRLSHVRKVRLLPSGSASVQEHGDPPLGYACLEMVQAVEKGQMPLVEAHRFGSPEQHVDVAHPVPAAAGDAVLGTLLVSLDTQWVKEALGDPGKLNGRVELQQAADGQHQVLVTWGGASGPGSEVELTKVAGTRWSLAFYPGPGMGRLSQTYLQIYWGGLGAVLVVLALALFVAHRWLAATLRQDLASVIRLVRDRMEGRAGGQYTARLPIVRGAMEALADIVKQAAGRAPPEPAGAGTKGSPDVKEPEALAVDLIFRDEGGLVVEEADEQAGPEAGEEAAEELPPSKVAPHIFKAYDIRGIVQKDLTTDAVVAIGQAIGSEAHARGQQAVAVARDGRLSGREILDALTRGLRAAGRDVIDIGMVPTPVLYFATYHLNTRSGVMVTGSHNPPEYNGMKIVLDGETLAGEGITALRDRIERGDLVEGRGKRTQAEVASAYIGQIANDIALSRPLKIVLDCGNGVTGDIAPRLFRELGCEVAELYCDIDGRFPNHHPDPSQPPNVRELIERVRKDEADLGIAFDGDGDRLGIISPQGKIIWPDRLMMLYAGDILSRHPGAEIIFDVKCSRKLEQIITDHGGQATMWKTGHSLIKAKMKETGALLAGEMSGHIFFKERWYGFDDALYAATRLLEILEGKSEQQSVADVFESLPDSVNTPELKVEMKEGRHHKFMDQLVARAKFDGAKATSIDGLRVDFPDGWGLVRASNTTPTLVLRFEADDEAALQRIQESFRSLLHEIDPDLSLPF